MYRRLRPLVADPSTFRHAEMKETDGSKKLLKSFGGRPEETGAHHNSLAKPGGTNYSNR
jgi:hypothetical protein